MIIFLKSCTKIITSNKISEFKHTLNTLQATIYQLTKRRDDLAAEIHNPSATTTSLSTKRDKLKEDIAKMSINMDTVQHDFRARSARTGSPSDTNTGRKETLSTPTEGEITSTDTTFMGTNPIKIGIRDNPILTPFQLLYLIINRHVKEVKNHRFQKAKISIKCPNENSIFTFHKH